MKNRSRYPPRCESGLRIPVSWKEKGKNLDVKGPFRLVVYFEGLRPEDVKLYAIYVS